MGQAPLRVVSKEDNSDKKRALEAALSQIDRAFGKGSVMKLGQREPVTSADVVSTGSLGLDIALADEPEFVLLVQPCPELAPGKAAAGLHLSIARGLRRNPASALDPAWKTGNYLNNLLCLQEARARGADEVVMLNLEGETTEAAVSNIAFARGSTILTPPLSAGILGGIRLWVPLHGAEPEG